MAKKSFTGKRYSEWRGGIGAAIEAALKKP